MTTYTLSGPRLKQARLRLGKTAAEVAQAVGINRQNYYRLESGNHAGTGICLCMRLARCLGVALETLIDEE